MNKVFLIAIPILFIDQISKIWVKTHMELGDFITIFPDWFFIRFVENPGMAYGQSFGGEIGKVALTLFRIVLIFLILFYIYQNVQKNKSNFFIIPMSFILAGAIGNVLDSVFYGILFDKGTVWNGEYWDYYYHQGIATIDYKGYSAVFKGCVVDMLHFPLFSFDWPNWIPIIGGNNFVFFNPIFNVADAAISIGAFTLVIFSKKAFG